MHENFILTLSGTGFFINCFCSDKEIEARKEVERRLEASRVSWEAERTELEARLTHLQVGYRVSWEAERTELEARLTHLQVGRRVGWEAERTELEARLTHLQVGRLGG